MKSKLFSLTFYSLFISIFLIFSGFTIDNMNKISNEEDHSNSESTMKKEKKLRHVVLFKFKEGTSQENIAKVEEAFKELPSKIPEIKGLEWGTNNSPEGLDKGFTHCFFLTFDSEEGRAVYLPHPDHKAFGNILGPFLEDVLVVDYWIEE